MQALCDGMVCRWKIGLGRNQGDSQEALLKNTATGQFNYSLGVERLQEDLTARDNPRQGPNDETTYTLKS